MDLLHRPARETAHREGLLESRLGKSNWRGFSLESDLLFSNWGFDPRKKLIMIERLHDVVISPQSEQPDLAVRVIRLRQPGVQVRWPNPAAHVANLLLVLTRNVWR